MIVWKLDELLRQKGVKGRELARRMEIGENYLSRVRHEVPDRLSLSLLDGLCRELDCTLEDLLEYRPDKPAARKKAAKKAQPAEEDFGSIVAEALGEALAHEPAAEAEAAPVQAPAAELPQQRWEAEPVPEAHLDAAPEAEVPPQQRWEAEPVPEAHLAAPAAADETPPPGGEAAEAAPEVAAKPEGAAPSVRVEVPRPSFEPLLWPMVPPTTSTTAPAVSSAPAAAPEPVAAPTAEVPQQRWEAEPVPEGHLDAPVANEMAPDATVETEAAGAPAAVLKGGALSARLSQLRRQRPS